MLDSLWNYSNCTLYWTFDMIHEISFNFFFNLCKFFGQSFSLPFSHWNRNSRSFRWISAVFWQIQLVLWSLWSFLHEMLGFGWFYLDFLDFRRLEVIKQILQFRNWVDFTVGMKEIAAALGIWSECSYVHVMSSSRALAVNGLGAIFYWGMGLRLWRSIFF